MIQQRIQQSAENFQKNYIKKPVSDKTVVLGKNSTPYLQNLTYPSDKIVLHKNSILIGRLEDSVDHVIQNNAVGKIHAELVEKDGEYCIIDLNSVNGTYVNGVRVLCNSATVINAGDKITFANESYTYIA
jgi:pSer/pThr/pTyr-binding forkhead associated (FHA) protein